MEFIYAQQYFFIPTRLVDNIKYKIGVYTKEEVMPYIVECGAPNLEAAHVVYHWVRIHYS